MRAGIFKLKPGLGAGQLLTALEGVAAKYKVRRVRHFFGANRDSKPEYFICVGVLKGVAAKYKVRQCPGLGPL